MISEDKLRPTILEESNADLLVYGMGDQPLREILRLLKKGVPFSNLTQLNKLRFYKIKALRFLKTKTPVMTRVE